MAGVDYGLVWVAVLWIGALVGFFALTTEDQRERFLLVTWGVMALFVAWELVRLAAFWLA